LTGQQLARAYANMDAFVFPSETDTFGNVVLEAMCSGLAPIVSAGGGPKYIINHGVTGFAARSLHDYVQVILKLS
jgi:phosphatidylinositol alpha 1,6-mannosyltransferase